MYSHAHIYNTFFDFYLFFFFCYFSRIMKKTNQNQNCGKISFFVGNNQILGD